MRYISEQEYALFKKENINYIRNSVKVIVNAYNGDMDFYITDRDIEVAQQLAIWHYSNENTATVYMRANDLMQLIREKGNDAEFVEI